MKSSYKMIKDDSFLKVVDLKSKSGNIIRTSRDLFILTVLILHICGCKKMVDVDAPVTSLNSENVYSTDIAAASVLTGLYALICKESPFQPVINGISLHLGLTADELILYGGTNNGNLDLVKYYINRLTTDPNKTFWENLYYVIYVVNIAEQRLQMSTNLTQAVRSQLIGEAKFMRAFFYFYLVNLYGDVPLITNSDYNINASLERSDKSKVWQQIINDLKDAQKLLSPNYLGSDAKTSSLERVRPNKWVATALLARAYLYTEDWVNAESQSTEVINNESMFELKDVSGAFLKASLGNKEAIWQLQPVNLGWNTEDARVFVLPITGPTNSNFGFPVFLDSAFVRSFESGDLRKSNWINSVKPIPPGTSTFYFPNKYKKANQNDPVTEYTTVLRLSEQYLIRAEARAQNNNLSGAKNDLEVIRTRAGLPQTTANDRNSLLTMILQERQHELFTEWGHRWLDLKRTGNVENVMSLICPLKGGTWSTNWEWFPLPMYDIQQNTRLRQNTGY